ncbi:hypothetical protein, partial [Kribbella catacumbae]|uniref:hypothetical protein n=1 Tax=Kribbella catacumbae TaxID=460086 RepID=UPI000476AFE2
MLPAGTVKAGLQWYDGKAWRHSTYIPLTKGKGTFSFKAAGRGTTRYWRVAVPKMSYYGKPIVAEPVANWLGSGRLCTDRQEVVDRSAARHAHAGRGRP